MILVDANLLRYAIDRLHPRHDAARQWWDARLSSDDLVGLCWPVLLAFIRIGTNPKVFENPLRLDEAIGYVDAWLQQPNVRLLSATEKHWEFLKSLLIEGGASGNLVSDAHLGALAQEHDSTLHSTDSDFGCFPSVKWMNPLRPGIAE